MLQTVFRLGFLLTLCAVVPVAIIRAQPLDNHDLYALLTPHADCPAPCFMGIRPGDTSLDEAILALQQHPWVSAVNASESSLPDQIVWWAWGESAPEFVAAHIPGRLDIAGGLASRITISLNTTYGDIALVRSLPDKHLLSDVNGNGFCEYVAYYNHNSMMLDFDNTFYPPITPQSLWRFRRLRVRVALAETGDEFFERLSDLPDFNVSDIYRASGTCWIRTLDANRDAR